MLFREDALVALEEAALGRGELGRGSRGGGTKGQSFGSFLAELGGFEDGVGGVGGVDGEGGQGLEGGLHGTME